MKKFEYPQNKRLYWRLFWGYAAFLRPFGLQIEIPGYNSNEVYNEN